MIRRPAKSARSEHHLQAAIVRHCTGLLSGMVRGRYCAIPNGAVLAGDPRHRAMQMARLKAEGFRAGMPDLMFWREGGRVLWVEVKNGASGRVSPEQRAVHDALRADGFGVVVVRDLAGAVESLIQFYRQ